MKLGTMAMNGRRKLRHPRLDALVDKLPIGQHPSIGLNLDDLVRQITGVGEQLQEVGTDGDFPAGENNAVAILPRFRQDFLYRLRILVAVKIALVPLNTE